MEQFKQDVNEFITKINSREAKINQDSSKQIFCLIAELLDAVLAAIPESAPVLVKVLISSLISILKSLCHAL